MLFYINKYILYLIFIDVYVFIYIYIYRHYIIHYKINHEHSFVDETRETESERRPQNSVTLLGGSRYSR